MKKIIFVFIIVNLLACNPIDCFEGNGTIIQKEVMLDSFTQIEVGNEISLIIKQGNFQKVVIESDENLIDNVTVEVIEGKLYLREENTCNFTRNYALTTVLITSPSITEIRSNTARLIKSEGILQYDSLNLISEDYNQDALNIGDFKLHVNTQQLSVAANGNSVFTLTGSTLNLNVGFHAGSCRFVGNELLTKQATITQKSSNDILVNPIESISGTIYSVGDVVSYNHPPLIEVDELYLGKLIFH